ncbi:DNA-3-methyladenine glycosylase I [Tropicimonas sp.]|uniref:DNA-3-methyladenine glycosylase I n=1 Tax=Tropicimonas sp. TaxID=2067044 RepID=UPI003A8B418B
MKSFAEIRRIAIARKGEHELAARMPGPPERPLRDLSDDRVLAEFSRRIFQTGLSWKVVDGKWPGFEAAFHRFDIARNAMMSDDDLDAHLRDTGIVRHGAKILSVRDNAIFLGDLARAHGSAARFLADWPATDAMGLYDLLGRCGARLGGMTGPYALRVLGYDGPLLSKSVVAALNMAGALDGAATSKAARVRAQEAFNTWHEESGVPYAVISRTLALAVPD